ncbi:uncharacterized protein LOC143860496 [Tasmannia lanceolata]|uniref:uncharacterized protein LOC143860496 n=1 Tax=Tasmannia lanceolata TaxID=3420 RepID=UPI0040629637
MDGRRRMTLSDQMAVLDSSNLGDLLKVRDEDEREKQESQTLGSVLACEKRDISSATRTLHDIIKEEESSGNYRGLIGSSSNNSSSNSNNNNNKICWKSFKDRIGLRRTSAAFTTPHPISDPLPRSLSSENLINSIRSSRSPSEITVLPPENVLPAPEMPESGTGEAVPVTGDAPAVAEEEVEGEIPAVEPIRVSLMTLLEQTDRHSSVPLAVAMEREEEGERQEEEEEGGEMFACCVCMVRHKGAAFIPCGHTFCRLCSRELWVSRGNCPLCNGFILEILDIF